MARISNFGKIDTLSISGELTVPLVILTKEKLGKTTYVGFVPALTKKDIVCEDLEKCKAELKQQANEILKAYAKENLPFPFFPTKAEIIADFKNVKEIIYIKIRSNKRISKG